MSETRNDIPSINSPNFNQRVRETLMVFLGRQGNPLDRGLTLRDMLENGLVKIKSGFSLKPGSSGSIPLEPGTGLVDVYEPDLTPPPTPTGLVATAAISHVMIEHAAPLYTQGHGHLRTRLYGKIVNPGDPLPTFADAVEIAQFDGSVYAHPSNPATTWRFWIKWETIDNVLSIDPAGGTNGVEAITGQDVSKLVFAMTGPGNPFKVVTEQLTLPDGTVVPVGTYTADAFIHNGQIANAMIANLAVDNAKIANLSASKITAGSIAVGQYIQSAGYVAGSSGWRINGDGNAEFSAASIRGQLTANQIDTRGLSIKDESGNVILGAGNALNWSMVGGAGKPADGATNGSNLVRKSTFEDGLPGSWDYAGIENRVNSGMPYAKNIYFHARDNLEKDSSFPVTVGEILFASGWLETLGITGYACRIGVRVTNAAGAVVQWLDIASIGPNTAWTYVTGSSSVTAQDAAVGTPWIQMDGFDFPANYQWVRAAGIYIGKQQLGANYITNTNQLTDGAGLGSTANWSNISNIPAFGNFAYLNSITSANISTYISGAAIGTAYIANGAITDALIANLSVGTIKIADNAVTESIGFSATSFSYNMQTDTSHRPSSMSAGYAYSANPNPIVLVSVVSAIAGMRYSFATTITWSVYTAGDCYFALYLLPETSPGVFDTSVQPVARYSTFDFTTPTDHTKTGTIIYSGTAPQSTTGNVKFVLLFLDREFDSSDRTALIYGYCRGGFVLGLKK